MKGRIVAATFICVILAGAASYGVHRIQTLEARVDELESQLGTLGPASTPATADQQGDELLDPALAQLQSGETDLEDRLREAERMLKDLEPLLEQVSREGTIVVSTDPEELSEAELAGLNEEQAKELIQEAMTKRDQQRMQFMQERMGMMMEERIKGIMEDLSERLGLSAGQYERIGEIAKEQSQKLMEMMSSMWQGGESASREEMRQQWEQWQTETDEAIKSNLTGQQSVEYDAWRDEQGFAMGPMGRMGGRRRGD